MKAKILVQLVICSLFISCGKHINTTSLGSSTDLNQEFNQSTDTSGSSENNENIEILNEDFSNYDQNNSVAYYEDEPTEDYYEDEDHNGNVSDNDPNKERNTSQISVPVVHTEIIDPDELAPTDSTPVTSHPIDLDELAPVDASIPVPVTTNPIDLDELAPVDASIPVPVTTNPIDLDELALIESGLSTEEVEIGQTLIVDNEDDDQRGLCVTKSFPNGRKFFVCRPIEQGSFIKFNRPCTYKDEIYLHGTIIPVSPGKYRITPSSAVITLEPGSFLICKDGQLWPVTLPENNY